MTFTRLPFNRPRTIDPSLRHFDGKKSRMPLPGKGRSRSVTLCDFFKSPRYLPRSSTAPNLCHLPLPVILVFHQNEDGSGSIMGPLRHLASIFSVCNSILSVGTAAITNSASERELYRVLSANRGGEGSLAFEKLLPTRFLIFFRELSVDDGACS